MIYYMTNYYSAEQMNVLVELLPLMNKLCYINRSD